MDELTKLQRLTRCQQGFGQDLGGQIASLDALAGALKRGDLTTALAKKKEVDDKQKEIYSAISRLGKAIDKKFSQPLPSYPDLFASDASVGALERTIALHLLRTGQFETAETLLNEASIDIDPQVTANFQTLHDILKALRNDDIGPALAWAVKSRPFLEFRASPLEFHLHRAQYLRLLLASEPPDTHAAIKYANAYLRPFYPRYPHEFERLFACLVYLPLSKLQQSTYRDLAEPGLAAALEPLFAKEYCASLGMSKQVPLRVVGDVGAGGALARIEKGRRVMRERKSEWSQTDELPIEIPLLPEHRYHSIFTCPVSKEQATETNPPRMMSCGHVITSESLQKLSKPGGRVKCPYCPQESLVPNAVRVYF